MSSTIFASPQICRGAARYVPCPHDIIVPVPSTPTPRFLTAIGILLVFETGMALLFGVAAIWPSALIELSRKLSPPAQIRLTPIGTPAGIFLFVLALVRGLSAVGWFLRRRWGWLLTMVVIAIQILRSIGNAASGDLAQGLFGATVAAALLFYLLQPDVRSVFPPSP